MSKTHSSHASLTSHGAPWLNTSACLCRLDADHVAYRMPSMNRLCAPERTFVQMTRLVAPIQLDARPSASPPPSSDRDLDWGLHHMDRLPSVLS